MARLGKWMLPIALLGLAIQNVTTLLRGEYLWPVIIGVPVGLLVAIPLVRRIRGEATRASDRARTSGHPVAASLATLLRGQDPHDVEAVLGVVLPPVPPAFLFVSFWIPPTFTLMILQTDEGLVYDAAPSLHADNRTDPFLPGQIDNVESFKRNRFVGGPGIVVRSGGRSVEIHCEDLDRLTHLLLAGSLTPAP